jgi:hypothetical protein
MSTKTIKVIDHGPKGLIIFLAYIGAAVYFVDQSSGFFGFIGALLKAIVWPAILVYNGLEAFRV